MQRKRSDFVVPHRELRHFYQLKNSNYVWIDRVEKVDAISGEVIDTSTYNIIDLAKAYNKEFANHESNKIVFVFNVENVKLELVLGSIMLGYEIILPHIYIGSMSNLLSPQIAMLIITDTHIKSKHIAEMVNELPLVVENFIDLPEQCKLFIPHKNSFTRLCNIKSDIIPMVIRTTELGNLMKNSHPTKIPFNILYLSHDEDTIFPLILEIDSYMTWENLRDCYSALKEGKKYVYIPTANGYQSIKVSHIKQFWVNNLSLIMYGY
jgi:hypothetical protein